MADEVLVLIGDGVLVRRRLGLELNQRLPDGRDSLNYSDFDAGEDSFQTVYDATGTTSMFCSERVIVLKGFERATAEMITGLPQLCKSVALGTQLIIAGEDWPKGVKKSVDRLKRMLKKQAAIVQLKARDVSPSDFIKELAAEEGVRVTSDAVRLLVDMSANLSVIEQEFSKLCCYIDVDETGQLPRIDAADVLAVCNVTAEADRWALTRSVVSKDIDTALVTAHRLLQFESAPHALFGMLGWQLRELVELDENRKHGTPTGNTWKNARRRREALRQLERNPIDSPRLFQRLVETNQAFNSTKGSAKYYFDHLLITLANH